MKHNYAQKWTVYGLSAIQKSAFFEKKYVFIFLLSNFCTLFAKNGHFYNPTTFIESLIIHKRFIF